MTYLQQMIDILLDKKYITMEDIKATGMSERTRYLSFEKLHTNEDDKYPFSITKKQEERNGVKAWFVNSVDDKRFDTYKKKFKQAIDIRYRAENMLSVEPQDFQQIILSDTYVNPDNTRFFQHIMLELKDKKRITINYKDYRGSEIKEYEEVVPLFIKENRYGRLYIVLSTKKVDGELTLKHIKSLGLDRIVDFKTTNINYDYHESHKKVRDFFNNIVGTHIPNKSDHNEDFLNDPPPRIKVCVTNFQARYIESMPIHGSQEKLKDDPKYPNSKIFTYKVFPTIEFISQLVLQNNLLNNNVGELSHPERTAIKVLEPEWLIKWTEAVSMRILRDHTSNKELENKLNEEIENSIKKGINPYYI